MKKTLIPVGPYHPLQEEAEFFQLYVEGETVVDMDVRISYNHRGIEKLSESMTFNQIPFLVERVCGICSASHPLAYIRAVEGLAEVDVPERALYLRAIVAELERIHSHVLWFGLAGHFIGYNTVFMWAWRYREPVLDLLEMTTGSRINYANAKIGGVSRDIPDEMFPEILKTLDEVEKPFEMLIKAVLDDPVLHARLKGVGILTNEAAKDYCVVGPTARASGVPIDVRNDDSYAIYDRIDWDVAVEEGGDVFSKVVVRLKETMESIRIIRECIDKIPKGDLTTEVREIPPGENVGRIEAPRGECFHYVRSDGSNRPARHKIRAPSYVNVPSFKASCIGESIADTTITLASVDPCYSCTERMAAIDQGSRGRTFSGTDLVKLSQEKTRSIMKSMRVKKTLVDEAIEKIMNM